MVLCPGDLVRLSDYPSIIQFSLDITLPASSVISVALGNARTVKMEVVVGALLGNLNTGNLAADIVKACGKRDWNSLFTFMARSANPSLPEFTSLMSIESMTNEVASTFWGWIYNGNTDIVDLVHWLTIT